MDRHYSWVEHWATYPNTGMERMPISQRLVTMLHICGVIPTPQSHISPETPLRVPVSPHRAAILLHLTSNVWVFHDVSQVVHNGLHVFRDILSVSCFAMFNNVLWCLGSLATISIGECQSPQGSAITPQRLAISPQGFLIMVQKWSHAKLRPEWRRE